MDLKIWFEKVTANELRVMPYFRISYCFSIVNQNIETDGWMEMTMENNFCQFIVLQQMWVTVSWASMSCNLLLNGRVAFHSIGIQRKMHHLNKFMNVNAVLGFKMMTIERLCENFWNNQGCLGAYWNSILQIWKSVYMFNCWTEWNSLLNYKLVNSSYQYVLHTCKYKRTNSNRIMILMTVLGLI